MMPRRLMVMARRSVSVIIIRGIRQHSDQNRSDCRSREYRYDDVALSGRGSAGRHQAPYKQANLEYSTEHWRFSFAHGTLSPTSI